jgi:PAS domain S-box-containing protein
MSFLDDKQRSDAVVTSWRSQVTASNFDRCLQAFFDQAIDAMLICDDQGQCLDANVAACQLCGLSKDQLIGQPLAAILPELSLLTSEWQFWQQPDPMVWNIQMIRATGIRQQVACTVTPHVLPHHHLLVLRTDRDRLANAVDRPSLPTAAEPLNPQEQQFHRMLNDLDDIIWSATVTTLEILYINQAVERISGYSVQTFLEQPGFWLSLLHPGDRQRLIEQRTQFYHTGKRDLTYRIYRSTGEMRWIRDRAQLIYDNQHQPVRIEGIATDITHQKQIEQERDQALNRLKMVLERMPMGCIMNDANFRVTYWNTAAAEIFGFTASEVLGKLPYETFVPIEAKAYVEALQQRIQHGDFEAHGINTNRTKDGRTLTCEWHNTPMMDDQGQFVGFFTIVQDISDRHAAEEALRRRDEMVQKLSEQVPGVIYQFQYFPDGHSCFPYASEAMRHIYGVTPEAARQSAEPVFAMLHIDDLARVTASIQESYETLEIWHDEYRVVLPEQGVRWVEGHSRPERLPDGSVLWHGYIWDVTDRKQIEQDVRQKAERERLLITITQHIRQSLDLKTILSTTVQEVLALLGCDRVLIYRLHPNGMGQVKTEALQSGYPSLINETYITSCRPENCRAACEFDPQSFDNTALSNPALCPVSYLLGQNAKSQLTVTIFHQDLLWGLLVAQQCDQSRQWQSWEHDLLSAIADQVSIAIHQSYLFQQIQQFNLRLENQVEERTAELQQSLLFESLLKRMTDRVRDSLDEEQILQSAVQELAMVLGVACCDAGIYSADRTICTITHESTRTIAPAKGTQFKITADSHIHLQLLQGLPVYTCLTIPDPIRTTATNFCVFACPLLDNQQVIGNLWLFKSKDEQFNDLEMRLVQQVANQCAIALRQSRLYQAAQAQVRELERLNHLKDDFLNTVSHELRTPMSNIKMATQMLEIILQEVGILTLEDTDTATPHRAMQYFQILDYECRREISLINDLLDLSRLEAEADPLIWTCVRLQDWIPAIAEPFEEKMRSQQQNFQLKIPADLPPIAIDLQYLERILTELLQNACKYTPAGFDILISANTSPPSEENVGQIQIVVCNTGVEIPARELVHVFDKFYRVPNNDPWKHGGTGLGLALIKKLIERLQGAIVAQSDQGETRFIMTFPHSLDSHRE